MESIRTACGEWGTCFWEINDKGCLTIGEGTGYSLASAGDSPWSRYKDSIYEVKVNEGVSVKAPGRLSYMFHNCSRLKSVDLSGLDISGAEALNCMFHSCENLDHITFGEGFNTSNVTNMSKMFFGCRSLKSLDLQIFNTSKVIDMGSMFEGCESIVSLDLSSFDTSSLISMSRMFGDCKAMKELDLSGFDTSGVTGMSGLFSGCSSMEYIDLSHLSTSNVINMISMFMNCTSLIYADLSGFDTSRVSDMSWMFFGCGKLTSLDLSGFNTSNVMDMSCMFCSCRSLKKLNLRGFDTSCALNLENMFMYCSSLTCLDLSGFDTSNAEKMNDMFTGCDSLSSLGVGKSFDFRGAGDTLCGLPDVGNVYGGEDVSWIKYSTGEPVPSDIIPEPADETYYIKNREFTIGYEANGGLGSMSSFGMTCMSDEMPAVSESAFTPLPRYVFKEWNTARDGSGISYVPGNRLRPVCGDMTLYAIWAAAPTISTIETPRPVKYGNKIVIREPYVGENNGIVTEKGMQISRDGLEDWQNFDIRQIPPVSLDGYYIRYYAVNFVGTSYTEPVRISVEKAEYDMSGVSWACGPYIYDGHPKRAVLTGLPEGVTAGYEGNEAVAAGIYNASAVLYYDEENYIKPEPVPDCSWGIKKASFDMSRVTWSYTAPFVYDGTEKSVRLEGLPEGLDVVYYGNRATQAGLYRASVGFTYDTDNYELPAEVGECVWGIKKAVFDMSEAAWDYSGAFVYDGREKSVRLGFIPSGVTVSYSDSSASGAGKYTARAVFSAEDPDNYKAPEPQEIQWEIKRADIDMSGISWYYDDAFVYDGRMKAVVLKDVPEGVNASYYGNTGINAGHYTAEAVFTLDDPDNYNTPEFVALEWDIEKARYDMGSTVWAYAGDFVYDGMKKSVFLTGLPEGVSAEYSGNEAVAAGEYTATAVLSYDEINYLPPMAEPLSWHIEKASFDMSEVIWDSSLHHVYDGTVKEVFLKNLPEGIDVSYSGNSAVGAGTYRAEAVLKAVDAANFTDPKTDGFTWTIEKSVYDMGDTSWNNDEVFVYDGGIKTVELRSLPDGAFAEYNGNTGVSAGAYRAEAVIHIDDTDNYIVPEPLFLEWEIEKAEYDMSGVKWDYSEAFVYDGRPKSIELTGVPDGVSAIYSENKAVYAASYIASAEFEWDRTNYEPPVVENCTWSIEKAVFDLGNAHWEGGNFIYDGRKQQVMIEDLPEGITPVYSGNMAVDAGVYTASAEFIPADTVNYEPPEIDAFTWDIKKAEVDMSRVRWSSCVEFVYDGKVKTVYLENLPAGVSVVYYGADGVNAGEYEARAVFTVDDEANYITPDEMSCIWKIEKADINTESIIWSYELPFVYSGMTNTVMLEGVPDGIDVRYENNEAVSVGTYTATAFLTASDADNYNDPEDVSCDWEIIKADVDMSGVFVDYGDGFYYNGMEQHILLSGLPENVTALYEGNSATAAGKYSASVSFEVNEPQNLNIPAPLEFDWEIRKSDYDISGVSWKYDDDECIYDGTVKTVSLTGLPPGVTAAYDGNRATYAGEYTAKAVFAIDDNDNYNIPKIADFTWYIGRSVYDMSQAAWDYSEAFVYDGSEKTVSLSGIPEGVTVSYEDSSKTGAGEYCAKAVFTVDTINYETPDEMNCIWTIEKAWPDMGRAKWDYEEEFVYDGSVKTVELTGLPDGVAVEYIGNMNSDAGLYIAGAVLRAEDPDNYHDPSVPECEWRIRRADFDMDSVAWDYEEPFVYDGEVKEIKLTGLPDGLEAKCRGTNGTTAGVYLADAELYYDEQNYNMPILLPCPWEIKKACYDMSGARWMSDDVLTYDGLEKRVYLTGLPDGVEAAYDNNRAIEAGEYTASAILGYDEENYEEPKMEEYRWEIAKASYDMSNVRWAYHEAFTYDGLEKSIELAKPEKKKAGLFSFFRQQKTVQESYLPEGVTVRYEDNSASDAGVYTALAIFDVADSDNYEVPEPAECVWEIMKARHDMSRVSWDYSGEFIYDGNEKKISLTGLPAGVSVKYQGNSAVVTGEYEAYAELAADDADNYETPEPVASCTWSIGKGKYDMSGARWVSDDTLIYDGGEKRVYITGLPDGVTAVYSGNTAVAAGTYVAHAELHTDDSDNYELPVMESFRWSIEKRAYDMKNAAWDYSMAFTYDGIEKIVRLRGLPKGVSAVYSGNKAMDAGTYVAEAELIIEDDKNYEVPVIGECKWRIDKASYDMSKVKWDYSEPFTYDERAKSVHLLDLPYGLTPVYSMNSMTDAGTYVAEVTFEYDSRNYHTPETKRCKWKINKASYDMSQAVWSRERLFTYDGTERRVYVEGLPDGVEAAYDCNCAIEAGSYEASARFIYDENNYFEPDTVGVCSWEIKKADAKIKLSRNLYVKKLDERKFMLEFETNADEVSFNVKNEELVSVSGTGRVTMLKAGRTAITIIAGGKSFNEAVAEIKLEITEN